jgi:DNA-binding CsgD family transcriptional regulator
MLFVDARNRAEQEGRLTATETRVAKLIASGYSYKEVALELRVSPATIRNQVHSVYQKLGLSGRFELAEALRRSDW